MKTKCPECHIDYERDKFWDRLQCPKCRNNYQKLKSKKYRLINKEKILNYSKIYRKINKKKIDKNGKIYRDNHKDKIKLWKNNNNDKIKLYAKEYYKKNKEELSKKNYSYIINRLNGDNLFRLSFTLRNRTRNAIDNYSITGKIKSSDKYGINYGKIIKYLEKYDSLWESYKANPSNYHIDHICPLSLFSLDYDWQIKEAFAPSNHQITI